MSSPCGTSSRVRIDGIDDGSRTVDLDFLSEAMRRSEERRFGTEVSFRWSA